MRSQARFLFTAVVALAMVLAAPAFSSTAYAAADDEPVCYRGPNPAAYYKITNVLTGKVLSVADGSTSGGAPVVQRTYADGGKTQWQALCVDSAEYKLVARHSGLVLDLADGASGQSAVVQNAYTGVLSQKWGIWRAGQSGALATFNLYSQGTGRVIDAADDSITVRLADLEDGDEGQLWTFEEVESD
jgi:hypothetical protein